MKTLIEMTFGEIHAEAEKIVEGIEAEEGGSTRFHPNNCTIEQYSRIPEKTKGTSRIIFRP